MSGNLHSKLAKVNLHMMSASNAALLYLLLIFVTASFKLCFCIRSRNSIIFCPEIEKQSLLAFKKSLKFADELSSWRGSGAHEVNCCKWDGVVCNNSTGHVTELDLDEGYILRGKINPSIGNLSHLQTLVLSNYGFSDYGLRVDSLDWLSSLTKLEHLNLNGVHLQKADNLARVINSLPSLIELSLKDCNLGPNLMAPPNDVNINATSLTFLDISHNRIDSLPFLRWIFQLNELLYLDFSENKIEGAIPAITNATKLQHIDLSRNKFNSSIPNSLYLCRDLDTVSLHSNELHGALSSSIANLTSLTVIDLSKNELSGKIPKEISYMCKIKHLRLDDNELQGEFGDLFGNKLGCIQGSLEYLSLNGNQVSGELPGEFKGLGFLDLTDNKLSGSIPASIGKLSSLTTLWLNGNNFTGNLSESLGDLFNLRDLDISDNKLEGVVGEANFKNLGNLRFFSASGNHLSLKVSPDWIPPFQLHKLRLGSWGLGAGSEFPSWLDTQKLSLFVLDLSNTGISGSVPEWIWGIHSLNLSHNHLQGQIPFLVGYNVLLSSNRFNGSLPRITDSFITLDLSNNSISGGVSQFFCDSTYRYYRMFVLHLGENQLSGGLPADCLNKWPNLLYLNIGDNNMSGSIPSSISSLTYLISLNLYGNKFSGPIPSSLRNCTWLMKIDLARNDLHGNMPSWIGEMDSLSILILHSNGFDALIPPEICRLNGLQILDLSDNKFSGIIPACIHNFTAMATKSSFFALGSLDIWKESASVTNKGVIMQYDTILSLVMNIDLSNNKLSGVIPKGFTSLVELKSLNLSHNHLTGSIPEKIGDMKQLESLDFRNNSLSGPIPSSLALITYLSYLNLSYNRLTGRIPQGTQLQTMNASAYIGNNLCGPPLTSNCSSNRGHEIPSGGKEDEEGKNKIEWIYVLVSLGYAVGFSAVCTALVLNKLWRVAYFGFLEEMWDELYVYVHVKWSRIAKPSISTS